MEDTIAKWENMTFTHWGDQQHKDKEEGELMYAIKDATGKIIGVSGNRQTDDQELVRVTGLKDIKFVGYRGGMLADEKDHKPTGLKPFPIYAINDVDAFLDQRGMVFMNEAEREKRRGYVDYILKNGGSIHAPEEQIVQVKQKIDDARKRGWIDSIHVRVEDIGPEANLTLWLDEQKNAGNISGWGYGGDDCCFNPKTGEADGSNYYVIQLY